MSILKRLPQKAVAAGLPLLVLALTIIGHIFHVDAAEEENPEPGSRIVLASEIQWTPLNPARGDASPQAGTLWGDRAGDRQTGFLVKFMDGFSSPPHIHNVTYRGVVISGNVHNDDPEAEEMWMPKGSYWTQPAGEVHITSAKGEENIAYIEIERGPYLVWPPEQASDNGERPVNVHTSNVMWLSENDTSWIKTEGPELAFLWGKPEAGETNGTLLRLPVRFAGEIHSSESSIKAVVIDGEPKFRLAGEMEEKALRPGSYVVSEGSAAHRISSDTESLIYFRTEGTFEVVSTASGE